MIPKKPEKLFIDPADELDETLEHTWRTLCDYYDSSGELPQMQTLFEGTDVTMPRQAAETVIANMLFDLAEDIHRFSPWYTKPPRTFGISVARDIMMNSVRCLLAPEAIQKWGILIEPLAISIRQNIGFIQAALYVGILMGDMSCSDDVITASCSCLPPHIIRANKSGLDKMEICCNNCKQPFA
jgi:hypothetical protein